MSKKKPVSIGSLLTSGSGVGKKPSPKGEAGKAFERLMEDIPVRGGMTPRLQLIPTTPADQQADNWNKDLTKTYACCTCMHYINYRCRKHAPRGLEGWPAVYPTDYCGDHKMDKGTMAERA